MRSRILLILLFAALPLSAAPLDVRPVPEWVDAVGVDTSVHVDRRNVRWGIYDFLNDHQVRVVGAKQSEYFRIVRKVLSASGVQNASELSFDFDPSFEHLTLHDVTIVRDGQRIDAMDLGDARVIDKEDDAEDRIYDGERTALLFVKDVRPGDVLDYSWSIDGTNTLSGGKYTDQLDLSSSVPAGLIRHRLVWPAGRPLQWRGGDPAVTNAGSEQVLLWERRNVRALEVEDEIPSWLEPWESIEVSEFHSWNEVARWADAMFRLDPRSTAAVHALTEKIKTENPTRDGRVTAAIRFVQDDIRYLGIEMGRNSHEPHQPWETLDARWGDCKDKSLLLSALLRELGLEAYPALVNTRLRDGLAKKLPSPFLFDHVITQVIDGGHVYWIDGTIADQGGTLATIETPNDGRALLVRPDTTALTAVSTNTGGSTKVDQTYTTIDYRRPTRLEMRTTYSGADADAVRSYIASLSLEDFAHDRINRLATDQPKIEALGTPKIADDRTRNLIVVTEKYRIPDLWKAGDWTWYPRSIESHLQRPDTMIRKMPLAFDWPLDIEQTVTFNFPDEVKVERTTSMTETPAFRYDYVVDQNGRSVWIRQKLHARQDFVPVKDVADHLTKLNDIWSEVGYRLAPDGAKPATVSAVDDTRPAMKWLVGIVVLCTFVGACWVLATKRTPATAIAPMFLPGEAPACALAVRGRGDIDAHLASRACRCGARRAEVRDVQRALYADREMTIVTCHCSSCGREQSVYFTAA